MTIVSERGKGATNTEEWLARTRSVMEAMPQDYVAWHARIAELSSAYRSEVAKAMQWRLNAHLKTLPHETYEERKLLASFVNLELRELGLAIRCPKTQGPAILIADFKDAENAKGRFRLQVKGGNGKNIRTHTTYDLFELELMEHPPRKEGMARKWSDRETFRRGR